MKAVVMVGVCLGLLVSCPSMDVLGVSTSLVGLRDEFGAGTGFVIGEDAWFYYMATAAHCVNHGRTVYADGQEAAVLWCDSMNDVAILMFPKSDRHYRVLRLADPVLGEPVWAVGYHWANRRRPMLTVFKGHVATENFRGFVGANTGLFPGISGGPLVNAAGEVVGINSRMPRVFGAPCEAMSLFVRSARLRAKRKELAEYGPYRKRH